MKKILIFSSYGGGGHISATKAIEGYLHGKYEIVTAYIFAYVLACLDPIRVLTLGFYSGEKFYNLCLQKKWVRTTNNLYKVARIILPFQERLCKYILIRYIQHQKPALVISVVPLMNNVINASCNKLNIPFLLLPTDLDPDSFIYNIENAQHMHIAAAFNNDDIAKVFEHKGIKEDQITVTGFPIKPSFVSYKNTSAIKKELHIAPDKKVILIIMGSVGSNIIYRYMEQLVQLDIPVHLIICLGKLGKNEQIKSKIEQLKSNSCVSMTIFGYTDKIADLMAIADVCITKAGTLSVCEALYMKVPIIIDNTCKPLMWEAFNVNFIDKHELGYVIDDFENLNAIIKKMLTDTRYYNHLKSNLEQFSKTNFGYNIKSLVAKLVQ